MFARYKAMSNDSLLGPRTICKTIANYEKNVSKAIPDEHTYKGFVVWSFKENSAACNLFRGILRLRPFATIISKYFPTLPVNLANYYKPNTKRRYLHSKQVITVQQSNGINIWTTVLKLPNLLFNRRHRHLQNAITLVTAENARICINYGK